MGPVDDLGTHQLDRILPCIVPVMFVPDDERIGEAVVVHECLQLAPKLALPVRIQESGRVGRVAVLRLILADVRHEFDHRKTLAPED